MMVASRQSRVEQSRAEHIRAAVDRRKNNVQVRVTARCDRPKPPSKKLESDETQEASKILSSDAGM